MDLTPPETKQNTETTNNESNNKTGNDNSPLVCPGCRESLPPRALDTKTPAPCHPPRPNPSSDLSPCIAKTTYYQTSLSALERDYGYNHNRGRELERWGHYNSAGADEGGRETIPYKNANTCFSLWSGARRQVTTTEFPPAPISSFFTPQIGHSLDEQLLDLILEGKDLALELGSLVGGDGASHHGARNTACSSESHLFFHIKNVDSSGRVVK